MKANQIFAAMDAEHATDLFRSVKEASPGAFQQAVAAACGALKIRPVYMKKQPFEKQVSSVRRALSLVAAGPIAEEMLAVYFLECRTRACGGSDGTGRPERLERCTHGIGRGVEFLRRRDDLQQFLRVRNSEG